MTNFYYATTMLARYVPEEIFSGTGNGANGVTYASLQH